VDGDSREVLLSQKLGQSDATLDRLDEDYDLKEKWIIFEITNFSRYIGIFHFPIMATAHG
jgi:hypothetical protein